MIRVAVTGGRKYDDADHVYRTLDEVHREHTISCLIEGEASGADSIAKCWAEHNLIEIDPYPANWKKLGGGIDYGAGPRRNRKMIDDGKPDLLVAFPGHRGTADMVRRATDAGIPVRFA